MAEQRYQALLVGNHNYYANGLRKLETGSRKLLTVGCAGAVRRRGCDTSGLCAQPGVSRDCRGLAPRSSSTRPRLVMTTRLDYDERHTIVFGSNLLALHRWEPPKNPILYNLEQVYDGSPWMTPALLTLFRRYPVWDYSQANIERLVAWHVPRLTHVPIGSRFSPPAASPRSCATFCRPASTEQWTSRVLGIGCSCPCCSLRSAVNKSSLPDCSRPARA